GVVRDVLLLDNACSEVLSSRLSKKQLANYLYYVDMTDEERALNSREQELIADYRSLAASSRDIAFEYNGVEYSDKSAEAAYYSDKIDYDTYTAISRYISSQLNARFGEIYLEMISVRNQIAALHDYSNYAEYAYAEVYHRDYTVKDIEAFSTAVKKELCTHFWTYVYYMDSVDENALPLAASKYTGSNVFPTLLPYFAQLSDELYESASYIYEHGSYDLDPYSRKAGTSYTRTISYYNMPFYFNNPTGTYSDLTTAIHELGHANNAYWSGHDWNDPSTDVDTAEVHSQGLELLMLKFYPELFGTQADAVAQSTIANTIYSVIQGCIHDELQRYAYSTPNVTLKQINEFYCKIMKEYGRVEKDDPRTEMYGWYEVPHTFQSPMYYISYATSAAGALMFWEESQEDYFAAVDHYLAFVAQPGNVSFQDSFKGVNLDSPLSPEYIQKLDKTMREKVMVLKPFEDVYMYNWYAMGVYVANYYGLMNGTSETTYSPKQNLTKAQILTVLARLANLYGLADSGDSVFTLEQGVAWAVEAGLADGDNLKDPVTREEFAVLMCDFAKLLGAELEISTDLSDFGDADKVSEDAVDAMTWMVENGILAGAADMEGNVILDPQGVITRGQFATLLYRFIMA
ncbi:MAG: S-layer homology domain-containing protein, partial [Oscillospiraceae bacterium]|nr:S-layer homology domain-containing protein [Oscillospiraceae bacterium]